MTWLLLATGFTGGLTGGFTGGFTGGLTGGAAPLAAARTRVPIGLPIPVQASQPGPAEYAPLLPLVTSLNADGAGYSTGCSGATR